MAALGKKTVILVTHQVEFLSEVDKTLVYVFTTHNVLIN
jgi:energy-coupling factor transporter ATP-binding protein EcfA2